ncbi:hypothetical protein L1049_022520 [Liquidambar formosana]|uniref:Uncharacterized protein n=1 Tax=Liquidambar formosana TaxID=63359 RepID=A0AAP0WR87_LIQFO
MAIASASPSIRAIPKIFPLSVKWWMLEMGSSLMEAIGRSPSSKPYSSKYLAHSPSPSPQIDVVFSIVGFPSDVCSVLLDPTSGILSVLSRGVIYSSTPLQSSPTRLHPLLAILGKVNYMGGPRKGQFAKLENQITITLTMVGLVEGFGDMLEGVLERGSCFAWLSLAQHLRLRLKAHGEGNLDTQALILAFERLNNVAL